MSPPLSFSGTLPVLVSTALVLSCMWWLSTRRRPGLPPGPGPALPLLGHLHLLAKQDPRVSFRTWRHRYGNVFSLYMGAQLVVVLNGYRVIREALVKNADVFSDRPHLPFLQLVSKSRGVIDTSGKLWRDQRKTTVKILRDLGMGKNLLASKVLEEVATFVQAVADRVKATPDGCLDLEQLVHRSIANNICSVVFGRRFDYDDEEFTKYLDILDSYIKAGGVSATSFICPALRYLPGDLFQIKKKARLYGQLKDTFVQPILDRYIRDFDEGSVDNFISAYIEVIHNLQDEETKKHVNENNLQRLVLELFGGATDTTATAVLWALAYLLHYPHVQERCYQEVLKVVGSDREPNILDRPEMTYTEATIMEVLRFSGTSPLAFPHAVSHDVSFEGFVIPEGAFVLVYLDTALRDPDVWEAPDEFRPERFLNLEGKVVRYEELIPFGAGKRVCLGETLARTEMFLYLSTMLQRFHFLPPEDGQLPSLEGIMGITKCPHPFKVRIMPREPR